MDTPTNQELVRFCDFQLELDDGTFVPISKYVLARSSRFFYGLLLQAEPGSVSIKCDIAKAHVVKAVVNELHENEIDYFLRFDQLQFRVDVIVFKHFLCFPIIEHIKFLLNNFDFGETVNLLTSSMMLQDRNVLDEVRSKMLGYNRFIIENTYSGLSEEAITMITNNHACEYNINDSNIEIYSNGRLLHTKPFAGNLNATSMGGILFVTEKTWCGDGHLHVINMYTGKTMKMISIGGGSDEYHNESYVVVLRYGHVYVYTIEAPYYYDIIFRLRDSEYNFRFPVDGNYLKGIELVDNICTIYSSTGKCGASYAYDLDMLREKHRIAR